MHICKFVRRGALAAPPLRHPPYSPTVIGSGSNNDSNTDNNSDN